MARTHKLSEIKGLDTEAANKLTAAGVTTVEQLLQDTSTPHDKSALAKKVGMEPAQLTGWINRADLMRLKGVGTEMANLLELCGVDSCKELQHRKPETLAAKLKEVNDEKHITHHAPTEAQVADWVTEAKEIVAGASA